MHGRNIIDLYERHAQAFDRARGRSLQERAWLDRFLSHVPAGGTVLDLGCGSGEPIARHLLSRGFSVVGVDGSPSMIDLCRARFPDTEWLVRDMHALDLERRFDGILAWDRLDRQDTEGCRVRLRLQVPWPQTDDGRSSLYRQLLGAREFSSGHAAMQALDLSVRELFLQYP